MSTELEYANQSEAYKNFIGSLDSEETKRCYRFSLSYFIRFCKLTVYEDIIKIDQPKLEGIIRDYIIHLRQDKKLSPASVSAYIAAVAHFCEMNDITIRWRKLKKFKGKFHNVIEDKPYTREQIKFLIDAALLRDKCIILLMASSGMRRGALGLLRLRDLQKIDKYGLYKINVYKKEQEQYTTFCTPECARYIDQYLEWRTRLGEKLQQNSPLLRVTFDTVTEVDRPKAITPTVVTKMTRKVLDNTGMRASTNEPSRRTELMPTHGYRKFFKTTCINAGMNPLYSEYLMGHPSGLTKSYFKPTDTELLEGNDKALGYISAINDLTLNEEYRLRKKIDDLTKKKDEIEIMEIKHNQEIKAMRNQMNEIMTMIRQNPKLAKVKPEVLARKRTTSSTL